MMFSNKNPQVCTITQPEIFYKLKNNISGGASVVYTRHHEVDETYIRGTENLCKSVIGFDANALYLWCLAQDMPCGTLKSKNIKEAKQCSKVPYYINKVQNDKLFGFIECDIETPEDLKEQFGEFPPIFVIQVKLVAHSFLLNPRIFGF
jgi:hypothetical protein